MRKHLAVMIAVVVVAFVQAAPGQTPAGPQKVSVPFVDQDTVLAIHIALTDKDIETLAKIMDDAFEDSSASGATRPGVGRSAEMRKWYAGFTKAGGKDFYVVGSLKDFDRGSPVVTIPMDKVADPEGLMRVMQFHKLSDATTQGNSGGLHATVIRNCLVASRLNRMEALQQYKPVTRKDLSEAMQAAGPGALQIVFAPSKEMVESLQEMMPKLPEQLGGQETGPLANVTWCALGARISPTMGLRLTVQAKDEDSAKAINAALTATLKALTKEPAASQESLGMTGALSLALQAAKLVKPQLARDRITVVLDDKKIRGFVDQTFVPFVQGANRRGMVQAGRFHLANIVEICQLYAGNHKGQFPPDLKTAIEEVKRDERMLVNPRFPRLKPGFIYIKPKTPAADMAKPGQVIIVYENYDRWDYGVSVGYADGSVKLITDRAELERQLKAAGIQPPKISETRPAPKE